MGCWRWTHGTERFVWELTEEFKKQCLRKSIGANRVVLDTGPWVQCILAGSTFTFWSFVLFLSIGRLFQAFGQVAGLLPTHSIQKNKSTSHVFRMPSTQPPTFNVCLYNCGPWICSIGNAAIGWKCCWRRGWFMRCCRCCDYAHSWYERCSWNLMNKCHHFYLMCK